MDIAIKQEKDNVFLDRKELLLEIKHDSAPTPSKADVTKALAASLSVDEKQIKIDYILTKKGCCLSMAKVKVLKKPKEEKNEAQTSQAA
jgi:ribosomal protein S24E